jgi:chromosome segregation ATPase
MAGTPDIALLTRLREVVGDEPVTEAELRTLTEQADALVRALRAQLESSERRVDELNESDEGSLADIGPELRRVEQLRPRLDEATSLLAGLEDRARELRTQWLLRS